MGTELMSMVCRLFGHKWKNCRCAICGKQRDTGHEYHHYKCSVCGKQVTEGMRKNGFVPAEGNTYYEE